MVFAAAWLGARAFPRVQLDGAVLPMPPERRAEGRFLAVLMGLVLATEALRSAAMDAQAYSDATTAVMTFPTRTTLSGTGTAPSAASRGYDAQWVVALWPSRTPAVAR